MSVSHQGKTLVIDGLSVQLPWPPLEAIEQGDKCFVLLDPDSYLLDPNYKKPRHGGQIIRNLWAFDRGGLKLWEAELPQDSDYYYLIVSVSPLVANSFSSYRCEIDPNSGAIINMEFLK